MYNENFCIRRIKELMKRNGYNTYHLSKQSGVSLSTLSSMFEKNTEPRVETIEKICAACDITVSQFFDHSSSDLTDSQGKGILCHALVTSDSSLISLAFTRGSICSLMIPPMMLQKMTVMPVIIQRIISML